MNTYVSLNMLAIISTLSNLIFILGIGVFIIRFIYKSNNKSRYKK